MVRKAWRNYHSTTSRRVHARKDERPSQRTLGEGAVPKRESAGVGCQEIDDDGEGVELPQQRLPVCSPEASLVPLAMEKDVVARVGPGVEGRESALLRSGPHRRRGLYYSDS